jgi:hypothetical protein
MNTLKESVEVVADPRKQSTYYDDAEKWTFARGYELSPRIKPSPPNEKRRATMWSSLGKAEFGFVHSRCKAAGRVIVLRNLASNGTFEQVV